MLFSGELQVVYFVNSGTEANELAMMMARLYTGNLSMIALRNAYHGGSAGTIGLTALHTWKYPIPQVDFFFFWKFKVDLYNEMMHLVSALVSTLNK